MDSGTSRNWDVLRNCLRATMAFKKGSKTQGSSYYNWTMEDLFAEWRAHPSMYKNEESSSGWNANLMNDHQSRETDYSRNMEDLFAELEARPSMYKNEESSSGWNVDLMNDHQSNETDSDDPDDQKDLDNLVITVSEDLRTLRSVPKPICRVPTNLSHIHRNDFNPKLVSIGPFHYQNLHYKPMLVHKMRFVTRVLDKISAYDESAIEVGDVNGNHNAMIERLARETSKSEDFARGCYTEAFPEIDSKEFVMMMIFDGCFVVELLRLYAKLCDKELVDDPIFTTRWMLPNIQRDFLLLENQLPFTIVKLIFELTSSQNEAYSLQELVLKFFEPLLPKDMRLPEEKNKLEIVEQEPIHLLDFFRSSFLSSFKDKRSWNNYETGSPVVLERQYLTRCVTELREAGAKFRKRNNHDLLDIHFKDGFLEIPTLLVDSNTSPVFLNFIAYEQCDRYSDPYFTHYVLFLGSLIKSSKDIELLHKFGIINHVLGCDADVASLFSKLCEELVHDLYNCYLSKPLREVNSTYCTKWLKWKAKWKSDYFSNPWVFSSFLAAVFLLLLATIQTFFSIFSYVRPPHPLS